jgi:hypothetical protein
LAILTPVIAVVSPLLTPAITTGLNYLVGLVTGNTNFAHIGNSTII